MTGGRDFPHHLEDTIIKGGVMNSTTEFENNDDLAFFGKVNASISHELKNILAIISETAGLLNDLTKMATERKGVELETLRTCSKDIVEETQRGFVTIKQMNRFSHSADDPFKKVNLIEVLDLMIDLAGFLSFASKVRFDPPKEASPLVLTSSFRFQSLIYQALVFAFESAGPDGEIHVAIYPDKNDSIRITFSGLGPIGTRMFPSDKTKRIAASIHAEIRVAKDSQRIDIVVPNNMESRR
jgi:signal transduction histidine kinase